MLTRAARTTIAASISAIAAGAVLGYPQLTIVGLGLLLAVGASCAWLLVSSTFEVTHTVERTRVTAGEGDVTATVTITNHSARSTLPVVAVEWVGGRAVEMAVGRLGAGASATLSFAVGTDHRGVIPVGPLEISRADPFGFTSTERRLGAPATLYVHPRRHRLAGLPASLERSLDGSTSDASPRGTQVFHALREYVPGDDLRLIHWKATARTGTPTVRQHVDTSQPDLTVVVDTRACRHDAESFEHAIEVAASLCMASTARRFPVRLLATGGGTAEPAGDDDAEHLLDRLAALTPTEEEQLRVPPPDASAGSIGPALALVTSRQTEDDLDVVARSRQRYRSIIVIDIGPGGAPAAPGTGIEVVHATTSAELAQRWNDRGDR